MRNNWSLVIHEVSQTSAVVWLGTLKRDMRKYASFKLSLYEVEDNWHNEIAHLRDVRIDGAELKRPFAGLNQRFCTTYTFTGLQPGKRYRVDFIRPQQGIDREKQLNARTLSYGTFTTLPENLQTKEQGKPFVVALGSCFYPDEDDYAVGAAYEALMASGKPNEKPDIKMLTGDQVYLDIGLDSLSPVFSEIQDRIAEDYAEAWLRLRKMLRHGGTWMLADDHEFWNNYPFTTAKNPYLWMITASSIVKNLWKRTALDGVRNVQRITDVKTFSIGEHLSFMVVDARSKRNKHQFMGDTSFERVCEWARNLSSPGVLVLPQPLIVEPGTDKDWNMANYAEQYTALTQALASTGHDILVLSGDVHYGRAASVKLGNAGGRLYEVIASPLSNLTGIDGRIAASVSSKVNTFPPFTIDGVPRRNVDYPENHWLVDSESTGGLFGVGDYEKTKEHFTTLSFSLSDSGEVNVEVKVWLVRERTASGKPKQQYKRPDDAWKLTLS